MINLTPERMAERKRILQGLYDEGYRYLCRAGSMEEIILAGKVYGVRIHVFGIWAMEDCLSLFGKVDDSLFPDVQPDDEVPYRIEDGL